MDYYREVGRGSTRGRSSFRGSTYRGSSRGSYRGSYMRGRGGSSSGSGYYESSKYDSGDKYASSARQEVYTRRPESYPAKEERSSYSETASRKRVRPSESSPQGYTRRLQVDPEEYRSSSRYSSSSYSDSRNYEDSRVFKKPRAVEYHQSYKVDQRVKEPLRVRPTRGRGSFRSRGTVYRREPFSGRHRGSGGTSIASTSEILAIRKAKLLQTRLKGTGKDKESEQKNGEGEIDDGSADAKKEKIEESLFKSDDSSVHGEPTDEELTNMFGRPYMKLQCPHCTTKAITFREYVQHLYGAVHLAAMQERTDQLKSTLAAMRIEQREKQKVIEEEDLTNMSTKTMFCLICKLNYTQDVGAHKASELHKKMKEFLMPFCKICRLSFQSPLMYENHLCSLAHLRSKHRVEEREKVGADPLDKFMVLDSVAGDADDKEEVASPVKDDSNEKGVKETVEKEEDLNLGMEFIRTVKVKFCEVCRTYVPRSRNLEEAAQRHCRTKDHLRCYLHYGNEELLEKIHKLDEEEREVATDTVEGKKDGEAEEDDLDDYKLWSDVGEILDEHLPGSKSDDEEEEGGRFDRFKSIETENGDLGDLIGKEETTAPQAVEDEAAV